MGTREGEGEGEGDDARRRERATSRVDVAADGDAMDAIVRALTRRSARGRDEEDDAADEDDVRAFVGVIEKYREQPTVLDPMLGGVIEPLMDAVARASTEANENENENENAKANANACCRALDALSSVRGWKTCVRFYPNAAKYLEPAVRLLREARVRGDNTWETQRVLTSWLSILALAPFDLVSIDSAIDPHSSRSKIPSVVSDLMRECKHFLGDPSAVRDVAAQTLAKLLTRPDMSEALREFMTWSSATLRGDVNDEKEREMIFLVPGVLRALAAIYKIGSREQLLPYAEGNWDDAQYCATRLSLAKRSTMVRQLSIKLASRVGLVFMKPRVVSWRYDRGARCLQDNLSGAMQKPPTKQLTTAADEDDKCDVHMAVDDIVEICLVGLRDAETIVRWTSAKALGRISSRLPRDFGDEVVGAVLACLSVIESDSTWHGACLALAELARRGLLLPNRLVEAVPRCMDALIYDVRRGAHSIGAHVRDAAAYVCWAFARAYEPGVFEPFVDQLAPRLLMISCFDREVNCRRAASAAFQEAVGRLGKFPHGIDIVTVADYFSLGSRTRAALTVAPFICQFEEYRRSLLEHVLDTKLTHWELATRQLATKTIRALGNLDPQWIGDVGIKTVLSRATSSDLSTRHGAVLSIGEMLLVTQRAKTKLEDDCFERVADLVQSMEREKMYKGKGGEIMRGATCRLIECVFLCCDENHKIDSKATDAFVYFAEESLQCCNGDVQAAASDAIAAFTETNYASRGSHRAHCLLLRHAEIVVNDLVGVVRRGSALVLGGFPVTSLLAAKNSEDKSATLRAVITALSVATKPEEDVELRDAETRVNATISLSELSVKLMCAECHDIDDDDIAFVSDTAIATLLGCLCDYSVDNRGDVGSWVRESAMKCFPVLVAALQMRNALAADQSQNIMTALLKQAFEKIDRIRCQALVTLVQLVRGGDAIRVRMRVQAKLTVHALSGVPDYDVLQCCLPATVETAPDASHVSTIFATLTPVLGAEAYVNAALSGWFLSCGSVGDSLVRFSTDALLRAIRRFEGLPDIVVASIIQDLCQNKHVDRVTVPALRVCDALISHGALDQAHTHAIQLIEAIRCECFSSRDISKLVTGSACLAHFVGAADSVVHESASMGLLALMANRFPRVRCAAAEHLYIALLAVAEPSRGTENAAETLSLNSWDAPPSVMKETRKIIYSLLGLDLPAFMLKASGKLRDRRADERENSTYASLVGDTGY